MVMQSYNLVESCVAHRLFWKLHPLNPFSYQAKPPILDEGLDLHHNYYQYTPKAPC